MLCCISPTAPPKVKNVTVVRTSDTTMIVTWRRFSIVEARGIITGYAVQYGPSEQQNGEVQLVDIGPGEGTTVITGLDPEGTYHVVVYAITATGHSASDIVIVEAGKSSRPNNGCSNASHANGNKSSGQMSS